jgi:hypothetical protein
MAKDLKNINNKKLPSRGFLFAVGGIILIILTWAGLTRAGLIQNYLDLEILCSETKSESFDADQGALDPGGKNESAVDDQDYEDFTNYGGGGGGGGLDLYKPVIYLYPEKEQVVTVKVKGLSKMLFSYPDYNNGWSVLAYPDGKIINNVDDREYSYLFWEGEDAWSAYDMSAGFVVKGSDTIEFLQAKLAALGLTPKEYNEFIVYWLPQMQNNKYNLIHFATKEEYDDRIVLDIKPRPDAILRVFMTFKKLENEMMAKPQEIKSFARKGFTVVEWGGAEIK